MRYETTSLPLHAGATSPECASFSTESIIVVIKARFHQHIVQFYFDRVDVGRVLPCADLYEQVRSLFNDPTSDAFLWRIEPTTVACLDDPALDGYHDFDPG